METTKDPMEVLRQEVSASKMLNDYFHELVKENGGYFKRGYSGIHGELCDEA